MASKRPQSLKKRLAEIDKELKTLAGFRPTKAVREFKRRLEGEKSHLKQRLKSQKPHKKLSKESRHKLAKANRLRRVKNERNWNYFGAIEQNYPDLGLSKKQIRSAFTKKKKGLETSIPDVVWRNPSP